MRKIHILDLWKLRKEKSLEKAGSNKLSLDNEPDVLSQLNKLEVALI